MTHGPMTHGSARPERTRVVLFGATGTVGSRIATEAAARGHLVLAVSRSGQSPIPGVAAAAADPAAPELVAELARGAQVVASACLPPRDGSDPLGPFLALNEGLVAGARAAGVHRLVVVGGAGGLEVAPGRVLADQPDYPEAFRPESDAQQAVLDFLRGVDDPDWTYVAPAVELAPGERTGRFRTGGDELLIGADGHNRISAEDYAVAFVDELEQDTHPHARMSVAY